MHQQQILVGGRRGLDEILFRRKARPQHAVVQPLVFLGGEDVVAEVQVVPLVIDQPERQHGASIPVSDCSAVTTATLKISSAEQPRERSLAGLARPCRNGPDGHRAAQPLDQFVADVGRLEVGKHQRVGASGHRRARRLRAADDRGNSGIGLQFAIHVQVRRARFDDAQRLHHLVHLLALAASLGGKAEQRDARLGVQQHARGFRRGDGDIGQLPRVGIDHHRAIGEGHQPVVAQRAILQRHDEDARYQARRGCGPTACSAARTVSAVLLAAPPTLPSASPAATISDAK